MFARKCASYAAPVTPPSYVGYATSNGSSQVTFGVDINLPAGTQPGDLLIVIAYNKDRDYLTPGNGWSITANWNWAVFRKIATGSDSLTVYINWTATRYIVAVAIAIRNAANSIPGNLAKATGYTTTPDPPSHNAGSVLNTFRFTAAAQPDPRSGCIMGSVPSGYSAVVEGYYTVSVVDRPTISVGRRLINTQYENPGVFGALPYARDCEAITFAVGLP